MVGEVINNNTTNNEFLNGFKTYNSFNLYSTSNHEREEDFTVFPPSNHENLVPTQFDPDPVDPAPSSSPPYPVVPRWWFVSVEILRSRIGNIWSYFGCGGGGRAIGKFGNVSFVAAAAVVGLWLWVRVRPWMRRRRRRENVGHLLRIIREKNERIVQLLNQIAQMNEVLLARHKTLASGN